MPTSDANYRSGNPSPVLRPLGCRDSSKRAAQTPSSFVFCKKLLGYFSAEELLKSRRSSRPGEIQSGQPGAVCANELAHGTSVKSPKFGVGGSDRNRALFG